MTPPSSGPRIRSSASHHVARLGLIRVMTQNYPVPLIHKRGVSADSSTEMWRRTQLQCLEYPEGVLAWLAAHPKVHTLFLDIENTISPYHASPSDLSLDMLNTVSRTRSVRSISAVVFISNGTLSPEILPPSTPALTVSLVTRARKPFVRRVNELGLLPNSRAVVCGDQPLTDGLLAWRLGVPFLYVRRSRSSEPRWPRLLRWLGESLALPVFFVGQDFLSDPGPTQG
jgi:predicted HAD superfamily phosphohydrolase YqeG